VLKEVIQTNSRSLWLITPHAAGDLFERYGSAINDPKALIALSQEKPVYGESEDDRIANSSLGLEILADSGHSLVGPYAVRSGNVPERGIAIIPVEGVLMKYDSCGSYGTQSMADMITRAANHPNVIGIIAEMDTPGGNVAGVRLMADAINEARKKKPVVAFVNDGMCASGGYWLASQCDEIISSHSTNIIGSIGVMIGFRDTRKRDEALGIQDIVVYADGSEEKHGEFRSAMEGDFTGLKLKMLNPIREAFKSAVTSGRGGKLKTDLIDPLKGAIFGDETSIKLGLVDSIGDLQAAVAAVSRRAKDFSNNKNKSTHQSKSSMKMKLTVGKHDSLITALGLKATEGQTEFEVDAVELIAAQDKGRAEAIASAISSIEKLTETVRTLASTVKTTGESITAIQEEVKTLGDGSGIIRKPKAETGDGGGNTDKPKGKLFLGR
jgi:protease IV